MTLAPRYAPSREAARADLLELGADKNPRKALAILLLARPGELPYEVVVASNKSSLPEVVGDAGLLADPRDPADFARAIVRAVGGRDFHERLRALGLARAAEFSWDEAARRLRAVLAAAAGGSAHSRRGAT